MEGVGRKSSGAANGWSIKIPPPDYESSSLDLSFESRTVKDENKSLEPINMSQTYKREENLFQTNFINQSSTANDDFHKTPLKTPELISRNTASTQKSSKPWNEDGFSSLKDGHEDCFHTIESVISERPKELVMLEKSLNVYLDPFKSPPNKVQSPQTVASNPFSHTEAAEADLFQAGSLKRDKLSHGQENKHTLDKERDIFGQPLLKNLDIFSSSSATSIDPFPSPLSRNLFNTSNLDDPFGPTPSKQQDYYQDVSNSMSDIFQPRSLEAEVSEDLSEMISSNSMYSTPLIDSSSDVKLNTLASTSLPKKMPKPPPPYKPKRPNTLKDLVLTPSQESTQDLQSTPFSQSSSLSASPSLSLTDITQVCNDTSGQTIVQTF